MSYILDALKKAEEERRRGVPPDVLTVQDVRSVKAGNSRSLVVYLLLAALVLNAGMLAWWLGSWKGERPVKTGQKAEGERMVTATGRIKDVFDPAASVAALPAEKKASGTDGKTSPHPGTEKKLPSVEASSAGKESNRPPAGDAGVSGSVGETPEAVTMIREGHAGSDAAPPPPNGDTVYDVNQLPSSIRQDLPALKMSLHYFTADPSMRLVRINGETMREGQNMSNGLRLDEVTADGAVFDYRHYRFRLVMQPQ